MSEVAEVVAEEPVTVTEEQNTEQVAEASDSTPDSTEAETTKPESPPETDEQKRSKYQRRIDRKNADIAAARTEARMYRERLEHLEAQARPTQTAGAPTLDQFNDFESYMSARVAYEAERVVETRLSKVHQQEAARKAEAAQHQVMTSWGDKQAEAKDKYSDFEEVVGESDAPVTQAMSQAIVESDVGADIAYYLAQHPDEAKAIAQLSPIRQIAAIGRLESKVSAPIVKKVTNAPAPITPTGSKATVTKDPSAMTDAEFAQWRKKQIEQRR